LYDSDATLDGNMVTVNTASTGGGLSLSSNSTATLSGNTFIDNTANNGGGLYVFNSGATLINDIVADNRASAQGGGLYIRGSSSRLSHTTIARNNGDDSSGVYVTHDSSVALTNTILVSHTVGINVMDGNTVTLEATLWGDGAWANVTDWSDTGTVITGSVNVWGNPAFVDPESGDYHITEHSAAKDAGVASAVSSDIDNQPRPNPDTGVPDLGADEHYCIAMTDVGISGSVTSTVNTTVVFAAVVTPSTATLPISYTWLPDPGSGQGTAVAMYTFGITGEHTISLTVQNCGGGREATHTVQIRLFAPGVPVLLSPMNGTVTTAQAITFVWQTGAGAAPAGYNLQVDGSVITTTGTTSTTFLSMGIHTWTVRAYNAAGYSDWAIPWSVVRSHRVYLPLVVRNRSVR
jgi:hypothetical protein